MDSSEFRTLAALRAELAQTQREVERALRGLSLDDVARPALVRQHQELVLQLRDVGQRLDVLVGGEREALRVEQRAIHEELKGLEKGSARWRECATRLRAVIARLTDIGRGLVPPVPAKPPPSTEAETLRELHQLREEKVALELRLAAACEEARDARLALLRNQEATQPLRLRISSLEASLEAARARRAPLLVLARLLVAAEDGTGMTDEKYDVVMDKALKLARTALSLERPLRTKGAAAPLPAPPKA